MGLVVQLKEDSGVICVGGCELQENKYIDKGKEREREGTCVQNVIELESAISCCEAASESNPCVDQCKSKITWKRRYASVFDKIKRNKN
jgi:hypothetical protein